MVIYKKESDGTIWVKHNNGYNESYETYYHRMYGGYQTKKFSLIEAITNTLIGYFVTLICSPFIYWVCEVEISFNKLTLVTLLFTLLSIIRGYVIRRFFNKIKK